MTLSELIDAVYEQTNRPDLITQTTAAVKSATLKMHRSDFYAKDIYESGVDFGTLSYTHSFDYITFIANHRAFKYFKRVEDASDEQGKFIDIVGVDEILDQYGCNRTDIAYNAGRVLEIRSSVEFRYALIGVYVNPIVTDAGYSSWVAEQYPYSIVYEAARIIFKSKGQMEESRGMAQLVAEELAELRQGSILDVAS